MRRDELAAFIEALRGRLERGELADHPPLRLLPEIELPEVERAVRAMPRQVDSFRALTPAERRRRQGSERRQARLALEEGVVLRSPGALGAGMTRC
jgi:hypothetical protein